MTITVLELNSTEHLFALIRIMWRKKRAARMICGASKFKYVYVFIHYSHCMSYGENWIYFSTCINFTSQCSWQSILLTLYYATVHVLSRFYFILIFISLLGFCFLVRLYIFATLNAAPSLLFSGLSVLRNLPFQSVEWLNSLCFQALLFSFHSTAFISTNECVTHWLCLLLHAIHFEIHHDYWLEINLLRFRAENQRAASQLFRFVLHFLFHRY